MHFYREMRLENTNKPLRRGINIFFYPDYADILKPKKMNNKKINSGPYKNGEIFGPTSGRPLLTAVPFWNSI